MSGLISSATSPGASRSIRPGAISPVTVVPDTPPSSWPMASTSAWARSIVRPMVVRLRLKRDASVSKRSTAALLDAAAHAVTDEEHAVVDDERILIGASPQADVAVRCHVNLHVVHDCRPFCEEGCCADGCCVAGFWPAGCCVEDFRLTGRCLAGCRPSGFLLSPCRHVRILDSIRTLWKTPRNDRRVRSLRMKDCEASMSLRVVSTERQ